MEAVLSQLTQTRTSSSDLQTRKVSWFDAGLAERQSFGYQRTDALLGIAITAITGEIATVEEQRRTVQGMFAKFAAAEQISMVTLHSAEALLSSLPWQARLPKIAVDDGGVLMAWAVAGKGRTLVTVVDTLLHAVVNAGTAEAKYFPDITFTGRLPGEVLSAIPR